MNSTLEPYIKNVELTGNLEIDVGYLLSEQPHTFEHVKAVAIQATVLAATFGANTEAVQVAAWLHDISAIIPNRERIAVAEALDIEILPEEASFPMIIHQKLSVALAQQVFQLEDSEILSAIGCHTTLKANASLTDKIVFVADKIAWDQPGTPPYLAELNAGLKVGIDEAALAYLNHLWDLRQSLRVYHPWAKEARTDLLSKRANA